MLRLTLSVLFASFAAVGCAQQYTITKIEGLPGAVTTSAGSINDVGQIVGSSRMVDGSYRAFIWEQGTTTDLRGIGGYTQPHGINNAGTVVGVTNDRFAPDSRAFVWSRAAGLRLLFRDPQGSGCFGINEAGDMVGFVGENAFVHGPNGYTFLPTTFAQQSFKAALAINDNGEIVGREYRWNSEWNDPIIWVNHMPSPLAGGAAHEALAINQAGQIAGYYFNFYDDSVPLTWVNRVLHYLPKLSQGSGYARHLNNRGEIVGSSQNEANQMRAVIWRNLQIYDLNDSVVGGVDWVLQHASDINEKGQIVGSGLHKGSLAGFLLTPISRR